MTKLLLTVDEAAEAIGIRRTTLYGLIQSRKIESVLIGKARRIATAAVEEYVSRLRAEAKEAVSGGGVGMTPDPRGRARPETPDPRGRARPETPDPRGRARPETG
jgi:excisionase family DNA binding protein